MRTAQLGETCIRLFGALPCSGDRLVADFVIPPARQAQRPLLASDLQEGLIIVSTLPNIQKHACLAQIVELEEQNHDTLPHVRIVHVSADHAEHWREVDRFHPNIQAAGYSLCCADSVSREAFVQAFGVGVEDHHRVAHGLFALQDGIFLAADVPNDQMRQADVSVFLREVVRLITAGHRADSRLTP
ncbi:MAG: hypothetical protein ACREIG_08935 [Nitrospiraceae bacterium]